MTQATMHKDLSDAVVQKIEKAAISRTGISPMAVMAVGSIVASISLFIAGKRELAIFVGLWPPTFFALKSAAERSEE